MHSKYYIKYPKLKNNYDVFLLLTSSHAHETQKQKTVYLLQAKIVRMLPGDFFSQL